MRLFKKITKNENTPIWTIFREIGRDIAIFMWSYLIIYILTISNNLLDTVGTCLLEFGNPHTNLLIALHFHAGKINFRSRSPRGSACNFTAEVADLGQSYFWFQVIYCNIGDGRCGVSDSSAGCKCTVNFAEPL